MATGHFIIHFINIFSLNNTMFNQKLLCNSRGTSI